MTLPHFRYKQIQYNEKMINKIIETEKAIAKLVHDLEHEINLEVDEIEYSRISNEQVSYYPKISLTLKRWED